MPLFKYFPPARSDVISSLCLRYTQPAAFNDPFEAKPHFTGFMPEIAMSGSYSGRFERVLLGSYLSQSEDFKGEVSWDSFCEKVEYMRSEVYAIFKTVDDSFVPQINETMHKVFGEKVGALSLSEQNDNHLLWSHYAEGHQGFVLEFDDGHPYFWSRRDTDDDLWKLHKIDYQQERPQTTIIDLDMRLILLTKHDSWAYECEWKHFRPLNDAISMIEAKPCSIHLFSFPPDCLRSIIFGSRIEPSLRGSLMDSAKANSSLEHLRFFQSELDTHTYTLKINPVTPEGGGGNENIPASDIVSSFA